jgi:hypothetical protein
VEHDPDLADELERSAERLRGPLSVVRGDLASPSELRIRTQPALAIAPLHVIQVLDAVARPALLSRLRQLLGPGGRLAVTVVDEENLLSAGTSATRILPDMREIGGWVYSSEPLWILVADDTFSVRRVRERVSPEGTMERSIHDEVLQRVSPEMLEGEAEKAGFKPTGRRLIESGPREADSIVVLAEVPE